MNTPIRSIRIAATGLDLVHQTRLKLACSMLLAERMDVSVGGIEDDQAQLLVVASDHPDAASALALARARRLPTLTLSRHPDTRIDNQLAHGATVAQLNEKLSRLLTLAGQDQLAPSGVPLLLQLANHDPLATDQLHKLQRGALMVVLDTRNGSIALPAQLSLKELIEQLDDSTWSADVLERDDFQHQYTYRLPQQQSLESLLFAVARLRPQLLPATDISQPVQLRHWPDLDSQLIPNNWLMAIALLHAQPCSPAALATTCNLSPASVHALLAAAQASGLIQSQPANPPPRATPASNGQNSRFFSWVARRFGLTLFKHGPEAHA